METLIEIIINGVKNFGVEIVVLVLLAVFWRLFPRARSLLKKDDTEEAQKLETERIKLEVERQVQDKKLEEERLKAEAKKQEEERIKAKEAQRKIQDMQDQCNLGEMYYDSEDYEKALYHYRQAADQGHAKAQNVLGILYENGCGVPQDYEEAVKWYRKAAEQGDAAAQKIYNI